MMPAMAVKRLAVCLGESASARIVIQNKTQWLTELNLLYKRFCGAR